MKLFEKDGFVIIRGVLTEEELPPLRQEADRIAQDSGNACVRNIREKSPLFDSFAVSSVLRGLIPSGMVPVRSILFDKTVSENWPVAWHQDLTIAVKDRVEAVGYGSWSIKDGVHHVQPPESLLAEMVTVRIHLDPTPSENGALRVVSGSHLLGRLSSDQVRSYSATPAETCSCDPGDVLLMSPLILHSSSRSVKASRRRILHFEFAPASALSSSLEWHEG